MVDPELTATRSPAIPTHTPYADSLLSGRWRALLTNALISTSVLTLVLLFVPTVRSTPTFNGSDAGIFYSVFHQISQGRRLYADIFDHKDPLFYYLYSSAYRIFGLTGPIIWETMLDLGLVIIIPVIAAQLRLDILSRLFLTLTFAIIHFVPTTYYPLHTFQQAVFFFLLSVSFLLADRRLVAGFAFAAASFSKMPMAVLFPAFLWLAVVGMRRPQRWEQSLSRAAPALSGVALGACLMLLVLVARGELRGYLEVVSFNLGYPHVSPAFATDFPAELGLWGRTIRVFTEPVTIAFVFFVLINLLLTAMTFRPMRMATPAARPGLGKADTREVREEIFGLALFALVAIAGAGALLSVASFWSDHFQIGGLIIILVLLPIITFLNRLVLRLRVIAIVAASLGMSLIVYSGGMITLYKIRLPSDASISACKILVRYKYYEPSNDVCDIVNKGRSSGARFAILQQSDPGTLAAWTPPDMRLACRVFYQFPWFPSYLLDEFLDCLAHGEVDVVFRTQYWLPMRGFTQTVDRVLQCNFSLIGRAGEVEIWERRAACDADRT